MGGVVGVSTPGGVSGGFGRCGEGGGYGGLGLGGGGDGVGGGGGISWADPHPLMPYPPSSTLDLVPD